MVYDAINVRATKVLKRLQRLMLSAQYQSPKSVYGYLGIPKYWIPMIVAHTNSILTLTSFCIATIL